MRFQDVSIKGLGIGMMGAGLLGVVLSTGGMAKAQDARDEAKPPQQEEPKQDEAKPPKQEEPKEMKPPKNEKQEEKQNTEMKSGKEQDRPMQNNGGHATRAAAQPGKHIPDDKFRANFGRQHSFTVQTTVVEGQPRFQNGGYWFGLSNAWPVGWAYTDACYIDFIDGEYVLIDLLHPGVQVVLIIVG